MKELYILGGGDLAKEIYTGVIAPSTFEVKGFFDDLEKAVLSDFGLKKLGGIQAAFHMSGNFVMGLSSPKLKAKFFEEIESSTATESNWPVLLHDTAVVYHPASVKMARGCVISAGSILTCEISLEEGVFINLSCTIGHNAVIGAFSSIMTNVNVSGNVHIGERVFIGSGATILPGIKIGNDAVVGAGAVVTKDVAPGITVVGVPARPLIKS